MRDSIVIYRSLREATKQLDLETRAKVYDAVMDYAFDGTEPQETGVVQAMFLMIKPIIDLNNQRYENGCRGGRPKNQTETKTKPKNNQNETNPKPNDNDNVNDNVNEKERIKKKVAVAPRFTKPSLNEVMDYCQERNNTVNAEQFMDFYESKGWRVGNQPMKDWRAAVRTWEKREQPKENKPIEYALPKETTKEEIHKMVEARKQEDEEAKQRAAEAQRRSDFIKSKGYASTVALISAGKDVYDKVMAEYRQAQGF